MDDSQSSLYVSNSAESLTVATSSAYTNPRLSLQIPEATPYKILIVGEPRVGKTAFVEALRELALNKNPTFGETPYCPTTRVVSKHIPSTTDSEINQKPMIDYIRSNQFSRSFALFATKPHGTRGIIVMNNDRLYKWPVTNNCVYEDLLISEYPTNTSQIPVEELEQFDKIIVMADYSDINTMRSAYSWATNLKLPKRKLIVCVNKCDEQALSVDDDFQSRKAKVMSYFDSQCPVEYISVKTRANLGFIYKYMN